jgi:hypothetical protein
MARLCGGAVPEHDKVTIRGNTDLRNGVRCSNTEGQPDVVQPKLGIMIGYESLQLYVENVMTPNEIARVQDYLRRTFGNDRITIVPPPKRGAPIEMLIGDEFIGVVHRDEDEGEVSYDLHITILSEDLPPASAVPAGTKGKPTR